MGKTSAGTDIVCETARLVLRRLKPGDLDALASIRDHARSELGFERLISLIAPANVASVAVAKRIGMLHERDLMFEGRLTSLFALQNWGQTPILHARA